MTDPDTPRPLVVFDLDGTLFPADRATVAAVNRAFAAHGLAEPDEGETRGFIGRPLAEFHAWLEANCPAGRASAVAAEIDRLELDLVRTEGEPYPGAREALAEIRASGAQTALCTNGPAPYVRAVIEACGLEPLLDAVRHHSAPADTKTSMLAELLDRFTPTRAVMIGDRPDDIRAAHACGIPAVGCLYGMSAAEELAEADAHASSPADLPGIVRALLRPPR